MSEKPDWNVLIDLQVSLAKQEERIIFLQRSNTEREGSVERLKKLVEIRFRWMVYLVVSMFLVFLGIIQLMYKLLS